jgi:hypothetical protein
MFLGRSAGLPAEHYIRSIVENMSDQSVRSHVKDVQVLRAAYVEQYAFDEALGPEYRRSKAYDERHLYHLDDVRVSPLSGLVWLPDGRMLGESYGSLIRLLGWGAVVEETILPCISRIHQPVIALPNTGYYHWLLEVLPAVLHCLQAEPQAAVLVSSHSASYVEQALDILAPAGGVIRSSMPVSVDHLILAAIESFSGFVPKEDVAILQQQILPLVPNQRNEQPIYVSRRGSTRSPVNELEVERAVEDLGFKVIRAERARFTEQVEVFRSAHVIAGVHGAGLANQVWSRSLHGVVEIQTPSHFNDCFARLAVSRDAAYTACMCQPQAGGGEAVVVEEVIRAAGGQLSCS